LRDSAVCRPTERLSHNSSHLMRSQALYQTDGRAAAAAAAVARDTDDDNDDDEVISTDSILGTLVVVSLGVPRRHPHRRQELATLPSVGANP